MYGHGAAPPTRSAATVISLRVLFAAAGFLSCGILACVPLFRVAILRGRWPDWLLAWVSLPVSIACFAVVGSVPESDPRSDVALGLVLLLGAFSAVYFLVMDIRYHNALSRQYGGGYATAHATTVHAPNGPAGYGYPQSPSPYTTAPVQPPLAQQPPAPIPHTPVPHPPLPQDAAPPGPVPTPPPPQRPAPARIDQVRAELDELSDYLRHHDGRGNGEPEGGR
ncbi:integral membrane protein [Streptomyces davaonensis JCM 4913]|uniref:Integral membrane protein n=1 Tax=Streptomyces davaonensis (strain DSM 101723 / JCM 4913 / KCC S-0913 / 768) TaxID=1214101 RepID=K4QZS8_STRDJ|nr:hypothetical protein [Streptomyces davaonensis]CCK29556.1 integral membrane protein [Streptomyces davaonensis JCM 4913]